MAIDVPHLPYSKASMILSKSPFNTDSVHFASDPALANLRVSGFLQAASALLFLAAGATPDRSCFFFKGATTSCSTAAAAALAVGSEKPDSVVDEEDAAAGDATAAADRDGSVSGPKVQSDTNGLNVNSSEHKTLVGFRYLLLMRPSLYFRSCPAGQHWNIVMHCCNLMTISH